MSATNIVKGRINCPISVNLSVCCLNLCLIDLFSIQEESYLLKMQDNCSKRRGKKVNKRQSLLQNWKTGIDTHLYKVKSQTMHLIPMYMEDGML